MFFINTQKYTQDNDDGSISMIFDRKEISGWTVEVVDMEDEEKFIGVFRTTMRDGKECEQFTLLPTMPIDITIVQVRIYKNGDVLSYGYVPLNTVVFKRKKHIKIQLYCDIKVDVTSGSLIVTPNIDDY